MGHDYYIVNEGDGHKLVDRLLKSGGVVEEGRTFLGSLSSKERATYFTEVVDAVTYAVDVGLIDDVDASLPRTPEGKKIIVAGAIMLDALRFPALSDLYETQITDEVESRLRKAMRADDEKSPIFSLLGARINELDIGMRLAQERNVDLVRHTEELRKRYIELDGRYDKAQEEIGELRAKVVELEVTSEPIIVVPRRLPSARDDAKKHRTSVIEPGEIRNYGGWHSEIAIDRIADEVVAEELDGDGDKAFCEEVFMMHLIDKFPPIDVSVEWIYSRF